jgi:hypothetical protein
MTIRLVKLAGFGWEEVAAHGLELVVTGFGSISCAANKAWTSMSRIILEENVNNCLYFALDSIRCLLPNPRLEFAFGTI